jgi:hypothetical protein
MRVDPNAPAPPVSRLLGAGVRFARRHLEVIVVVHVTAMLLFASWAFGGNIWWARSWLSLWGGLGLLLTVLALTDSADHGHDARSRAWVLLPGAAFGGLVVAGCLNPSFVPRTMDGQQVLLHLGEAHPSLPSTVNPDVSLRQWGFAGGAWLAACNLWLVLRSRRAVRFLFATAVVNTLVLAVFGTLQKLLVPSARDDAGFFHGFYFGAVVSPQKRFFATFIYNNHWGAFMVLFLAVAVGLLFHYAGRLNGRDRWHTPFPTMVAALLFIAASAPVSASRSATALAGFVVVAASGAGLSQIAAARRAQHRPAAPVLAAVALVILAVVAAAGWLARSSIEERARDTREALGQSGGLFHERLELYRDTWKLAMQKPVFGWGLDSFGTAFQLIRPRPVALNRQYEQSYVEAHSDWLQSVAENGFVGTVLLLAMGALPLLWLPRAALRHPLVGWPLLGCALVALYAWVEFPFANGAVMIAFWTVWFAALRLSMLQRRAEAGAEL